MELIVFPGERDVRRQLVGLQVEGAAEAGVGGHQLEEEAAVDGVAVPRAPLDELVAAAGGREQEGHQVVVVARVVGHLAEVDG